MVTETKYRHVVEALTEKLLAELREQIHSIVLFGSVARGKATDDSDIDVLIIFHSRLETKRRINEISSHIDLENEVFTQLLFYSVEGFEKGVRMRSWFSADLMSQGVVLYDDGTYERIRRKYPQALPGVPGR